MTALRWGVLGTGMAARDVATAIQLVDGAQLSAVGSESVERARRFAADFEIATAHATHAALLEDPELDAIYIASDPSAHHDQAVAALDTGKAVLLEKPFALNGDQARAIYAAARRNSVFCMEAMWSRFNPTIQRVAELVEQGAIGNVMHIEASLGFDRPPTERDHRFDINRGGGALLDLGVYPVSLIVAMLGAPTSVAATATLDATGVDLDNGALLRFRDGAWATVSSSLRAAGRNDMHIIGSEGRLVVGDPMLAPTGYRLIRNRNAATSSFGIAGKVARKLSREVGSRPRRLEVEGNGYQYQVAEACTAIRAGALESSIMSWDDSVLVMDVLDQIRNEWTTP